MNDGPRQKLQFLIAQYGRSLCDDPKRCDAMLKDLCPECKREIAVLIGALRENVAKDLLAQSAMLPMEALTPKLTKRLYDHLGIAEEFAQWAVESWAFALGLITAPMLMQRKSTPQASSSVAPTLADTKIIARCSSCSSKMKVDAEYIGKKVRCPKCQNVIVIEDSENTANVTPVAMKIMQTATKVIPLQDRPRPLQPKDFFETQYSRFIPEKAISTDVHISYNIEGDGGGEWTLIVKNSNCTIREGGDPTARTQVKMSSKIYLSLAQGKLDGRVGYMLGQIKIKGDKMGVVTARECFRMPSAEEIA